MRPSAQTQFCIALYFLFEVLPISRRMAKTFCALGQYLSWLSKSSKFFLFRLWIVKPVIRLKYSFICAGLLGFSIPVSCCASANNCALYSSSKRAAASTKTRSIITPRSLISWSAVYSSSSKVGAVSRRTLANICCSTSTSRILYFLKVSHLSGASLGRCLPFLPGMLK